MITKIYILKLYIEENIARNKATNDRNNKAAGKKRVMNKYDDSDLDDDDDDDFDEV